SRLVARGDDGDAAGEASEGSAEGVGVDHGAGCAVRDAGRGMGRTKSEIRYLVFSTALAGTKSPVTPTRRSAMSFRAARTRAHRFMSRGEPTTAPMTHSTIHLPLNSRRRS